jgi:hypothetical protein
LQGYGGYPTGEALRFWTEAQRNWTDEVEGEEPLPEECSLSFEEQTANLKAAYSDPAFAVHPLLPPYTSEEVSAMETTYSISFPPLFRYYIENISRETSFTFYRCLVQPKECNPQPHVFESVANFELREIPREVKIDGENKELLAWSCHIAENGCQYDETVWFVGRLRGCVQLSEEDHYPSLVTLYDRMMRIEPRDGLIKEKDRVQGQTLEETLLKCRDDEVSKSIEDDYGEPGLISELKDIELPDELKVCRRNTMEAVSIILGHTRIRKMVESVHATF